MDFECLYDRRTLYPVAHILAPFLIYLLAQDPSIVLGLVVAWEFVEFFAYAATGSYHIFPDGSSETVCDVVLLDLGNGVLGLLLGMWFVYWFSLPTLKMTTWRWLTIIVSATIWIIFLSLDYECDDWIFDCSYTAWGVPSLTFLVLATIEVMHFLGNEPTPIFWCAAIVSTVYLNITWIPVSTPLLMYYATAVILLFTCLPWDVRPRYQSIDC